MSYTNEQIADALDLAVLQPNATSEDVKCACVLANKHCIKSVCVSPIYVRFAASLFSNVSSVISFPHGNTTPDVKYREAVEAIKNGARELDMVINYGRFLDGDSTPLFVELGLIVSAAHQAGVAVKAILETCYYTRKQIVDVCKFCLDFNVDFVKTSTGFGKEGATPFAVQAMLETVGDKCQVKASGGIRSYQDACMYLEMGCTRLGAGNYFKLLP
jgi:deoxyribose-phosphate aldolase